MAGVGSGDVLRLRQQLDTLMALDDSRGGHDTLERAALTGAREAVALQEKPATQRTRQRLFSLAADYTATAAWCAWTPARAPAPSLCTSGPCIWPAGAGSGRDDARVELGGDPGPPARAHAEPLAAGQAARATAVARRDPLFASLAHARIAIAHAHLGDHRPALRSLGHAEKTLARADPARPRPSWIAFYGRAELHAITSIVHNRLGNSPAAEAASHHALTALPDVFARNRAFATARLALAQLHQGELDQATATTAGIFPPPGRYRPPRTATDPARRLLPRPDHHRPKCACHPGVGQPLPHQLEPHMTAISRYGHADLPAMRQIPLDVHADAYATEMDDPFHQTEKFAWFVDHWGARTSFDCVIAFDAGRPAGFAYGATAAFGRETWRGHLSPTPTPDSTFALSELMVRPKWRGTGLAQRLHDALLAPGLSS